MLFEGRRAKLFDNSMTKFECLREYKFVCLLGGKGAKHLLPVAARCPYRVMIICWHSRIIIFYGEICAEYLVDKYNWIAGASITV